MKCGVFFFLTLGLAVSFRLPYRDAAVNNSQLPYRDTVMNDDTQPPYRDTAMNDDPQPPYIYIVMLQ